MTFKLSKNFLLLVLFYFLGYTSFLGGPYWLARFIFILSLVGVFISYLFIWRVSSIAKKMFNLKKEETLKVDSEIVD